MAWWNKIDEVISEVASSQRAIAKMIFSMLILATALAVPFAIWKLVVYFMAHKPWWLKFFV